MGALEVNKVVAAILVSGIAFMGASLISDAVVRTEPLAKPAIEYVAAAAPAAASSGPAEPPIAVLLASADPARGEADTKSAGCIACHSFNQGGKAGVGPNLYGVVGAPHGHMEGFSYSAALKAKTGPWTFAELNEWLTKPAAYAPGTKMTYAGLPDAKKRADIIDYLRTLSPSPEPLPPVPAATATASAATGTAAPAAASGEPPFETLLASADPAKGEGDTKKLGCVACHTFAEGGKAGLGPNLYGVVGGPHAHMEGFNYSSALKAKTGPWTFAALNEWLTKPSAYAPGTKMTFAGIKDPQQRAEVIAYLDSLAAKPVPIPGK
jgi:cytochrome c